MTSKNYEKANSKTAKEQWENLPEEVKIPLNECFKLPFSAMMLYKGTICPLVYTEIGGVEQAKEYSMRILTDGLKMGTSVKQLGDYLTKAMDDMEKKDTKLLSEKQMDCWWVFCFALLKLKRMPEDDQHGCIIKTQTNDKEIIKRALTVGME